ncbi:MAG: hypothetical protein IJV80_01640 [Clostridia bacterium]|nr:hypothetical protein [Clostridia bacterium]
MRFRNAVRLLVENYHNAYKILLYKIVTLVISAGLYAAFLAHGIFVISSSEAFSNVLNAFKALFDGFLASAPLGGLIDNVHASMAGLLQFLGTMSVEIVFALLGCLLVYLVQRFTDAICYFTIGAVLTDRMDTYATTPFWQTFVRVFAKSTRYAALYAVVSFVFDALTIAACYFFFFYLSSFSNIFVSLGLSITLIAVCQSIKLTVTSSWMPAMTSDGYSLSGAIKCLDKAGRKQRNKVFSTYLVMVYVIVILNVVSAVCTFGSALILSVPTSYLLLICTQYVNYYIVKGKKYFVTYEEIEKDVSRGDSSNYFNYVLENGEGANLEENAPVEESEKEDFVDDQKEV